MKNTADTRAVRQSVRVLIDEWTETGRFQPRADAWLRSFDLDFSKELAERHLLGITWPTEYGGGGRSNVERLAVTEELLRAGAPVAAHWMGDRQIGPAIMKYGSEELKRELLPGIISADLVFCLGMSEPSAGSDLASVKTKAVRVDGGWSISGHKIWTSHAHRATHAYVLARSSTGEHRHQGLSEFIIDMSHSGVQVDPIIDLTGEHHFNEIHLTDVLVPDRWLLGDPGNGWRQVTEQLAFERGGPERVLSSYPVLRALVEEANPSQDSTYTELLGELTARLGALRRLCFEIAQSLDRGEAPVQKAAGLKYLGNIFERDVVEAGRQLERTAPITSTYADSLLASSAFDIRGGASDVLLSIIAKQEARV